MNAISLHPKMVFRLLKDTFTDWMEDNALRLSAALAYYSIFSIAPLIVIAVAIAGWVFGTEAVQGQLAGQLRGMLGAEAAEGVQSMVQSASEPSSSGLAGVVGAVVLLFGASSVFGQLKDALNTIWEVKPKAGQGIGKFFRERILSFGMVLVIGFLLLVSLLLTAVASAFGHSLEQFLPLPAFITGAIGFLLSFGIVTLLFAAIYKVLPDAEVAWRHVWVGAAVTALLFEIGKFLLGWYLGRESTASSYGAAASVVLVLLWVYYTSLILFFGAEFTQVYARARGEDIKPSANAESVTTEDRAQQGLEPGSKREDARAPAESGNQETPGLAIPSPRKESLPLVLGAMPARPSGNQFIEEAEEEPATQKPSTQLAAAFGVGTCVGLIVQALQKPDPARPVDQVKDGSKALLIAGATTAATVGSQLWKRAQKELQPEKLQARRKQMVKGLEKLARM